MVHANRHEDPLEDKVFGNSMYRLEDNPHVVHIEQAVVECGGLSLDLDENRLHSHRGCPHDRVHMCAVVP